MHSQGNLRQPVGFTTYYLQLNVFRFLPSPHLVLSRLPSFISSYLWRLCFANSLRRPCLVFYFSLRILQRVFPYFLLCLLSFTIYIISRPPRFLFMPPSFISRRNFSLPALPSLTKKKFHLCQKKDPQLSISSSSKSLFRGVLFPETRFCSGEGKRGPA